MGQLKIIVVDAKGGGMGKSFIEQAKKQIPGIRLLAFGTNSAATAAMLKAGADDGATGDNAIIYNASDADVIIGPLGVVMPNAILGEISPAVATAIAGSRAGKILLPVSRCNTNIVGIVEKPLAKYLEESVQLLKSIIEAK